MTFRFNLLTDADAQGLRAFYEPIIADDAAGHFRYEAEATIAFLEWRDGRGETMLEHFRRAASMVVAALSAESPEAAPRNLNALLTPLLVATSYATPTELAQLAKAPRRHWFYPETDQLVPLAAYIEFVLDTLVRGAIDPERLRAVASLDAQRSARSFHAPWIRSALEVIAALDRGDAAAATASFQALAELHERETDEGAWQKRAEGIVCLWGLTVLRVAQLRNTTIPLGPPHLRIYFPELPSP